MGAPSDSAYGDWEDGPLAAAVVRRCEDAYAELYRRHRASVAATARMILGLGSGCDDVVADVFVRFWISPGSFDPGRGSLLSFLRLKARGRSIDILRSEGARRSREIQDTRARRDPGYDADTALFASESATAVRRAVELLPPGVREAIALAFFEGMSYRAVALRLGVAEGTVKSRIRRGLRQLAAMTLLLDSQPTSRQDIEPVDSRNASANLGPG